jgi:hypothetical protein
MTVQPEGIDLLRQYHFPSSFYLSFDAYLFAKTQSQVMPMPPCSAGEKRPPKVYRDPGE